MNPSALRFFAAPAFAMHEAALRLMAQAVRRVDSQSVAGGRPEAQSPASTSQAPVSGVAILHVRGVIDQHESDFLWWYGGTSTDSLSRRLRAALAMPEVSAIVLDIDSPGGSVFGTPEFAAEVFEARKVKPIIAVANSFAASAAYWIGSAASEFYVTPSGEVGSIGCWMLHVDWSKALEDEGIKATVIRAGKYKAEGNPYEPLSEDAHDHMQAGVDRYHTMFLQAVAKQRGVSVTTVRNDFGEGRMLGAAEAKAAGMVDGVATLDEVVAKALRAGKRSPSSRAEEQATPELSAADDIDIRRRVAAIQAVAL